MGPILFLFEDPEVIAVKVAAQMGLTPEAAAEHMECWDRISVATFCVGNDYPRKELH